MFEAISSRLLEFYPSCVSHQSPNCLTNVPAMAENQNDHHTDEEGTPILPCELVESILTRLPVKSLLRFKSVSKLWNNIISDSHFIKVQSQVASSFKRRFLVWGCPPNSTDTGTFCLLKYNNQKFQLESTLGSPFGFAMIRGYCNGIVLLWGIPTSSENYVLWNPCSRAYRIIRWKGNVRAHQGLCYDISTDDYKVVLITQNKKYSVFTCKEGAWTKTDQECPDFHRIESKGVYVDGKLYWLCYGGREHGKFEYRGLLCYDGTLDECKKLKLPEAAQSYRSEAQLVGLKGHLVLVLNEPKRMEIWIMQKNGDGNSWRRLMPIENLPSNCIHYDQPRYMCFARPPSPCPISDTMIMIFVHCAGFLMYDIAEEKMIGGIERFPDQWGSMLSPCEDHLVMPIQN